MNKELINMLTIKQIQGYWTVCVYEQPVLSFRTREEADAHVRGVIDDIKNESLLTQ